MSEETYRQIEDAIERKLFVFLKDKRADLGGPIVYRPVRIEGESVVMEYCNGCAGPPQAWTFDRWDRETGNGRYLYRKVGLWEFASASDPAASEIAYAHQSPNSAGRTIYALRQELDRLLAQLPERIES